MMEQLRTGTFLGSGFPNPLTVIGKFTYLIFIKSLDDKQIQNEAEANLLGVKAKVIFHREHEDLIYNRRFI